MIIYLDSDFKCHTKNDGTFMPVETDFFNGKCDEYIEGFRYVPEGMTWMRDDGMKFNGFFAMPVMDVTALKQIQQMYEGQSDMREALSILGVTE